MATIEKLNVKPPIVSTSWVRTVSSLCGWKRSISDRGAVRIFRDNSLRNWAIIRCPTRLFPTLPRKSPASASTHSPTKPVRMPSKFVLGPCTAWFTMASKDALARPLTPPAIPANKAIGQNVLRIRRDSARVARDPTFMASVLLLG